MLRSCDYRLIEKEKTRFNNQNEWYFDYADLFYPNWINILDEYNLYEFTTHWYDKDPLQCETCTKYRDGDKDPCPKCEAWKNWNYSEKQLSYNVWIDVEGPGIWGATQSECNRSAQYYLKEIIEDKQYKERLFVEKPKIDNGFIHLFYYNRDRSHFDYWFVFKKKNSKTD